MHKIISISILKVKRQSKDSLFSFEEKKKTDCRLGLPVASERHSSSSTYVLYKRFVS